MEDKDASPCIDKGHEGRMMWRIPSVIAIIMKLTQVHKRQVYLRILRILTVATWKLL